MNLLTPFRALFAWKLVRNTGRHLYEENTVTGARRARAAQGGGYQPVHREWLGGGEFTLRPAPPRGGSGVPRPRWREAADVAPSPAPSGGSSGQPAAWQRPVYPADRCPTCGGPR